MKKILSLIVAAALSSSAMAQIDRSQRPEAGPAPELEFGDAEVFRLKNDLTVIVVENHKLPRVSMSLIVDRDPIFEGAKAGYVSLAGDMLRQGTTNRPKDQLDEEIDFIGARLNTSSNSIYTSGLSKHSEKLMEIMADVVLNPAFPADEFEKLRKQMISSIENQKDDPEAVASQVHRAMLYGVEHPYGEVLTVEKVENVKLEDVRTYYQNYWIPNQSYLAIVGDIDEKEAKKMVKKYFGQWQEGNVPRNVFPQPATPETSQVAFVNKDNAVQSVIQLGNTIDLKPGDKDVIALRLANQILGGGSLGRLFQNIREDKGYTYGAYSSYESDRLVGEFNANASVRNEVTDSAITEFINEFTRLRNELVSEEELANAKASIIGSFGRSLESPSTLARFTLNIQRYDLDDDYYEEYIEKLEELSAEDVREAAKKYIKPEHLHITVVGKGADVVDKLQPFGSISYYDAEANPAEKPSMSVPDSVSAAMVIERYISAVGGKENLQKVESVNMQYEVSIPGAPPLTAIIMQKRPNKFRMELKAEGMGTVQKQIYNGKEGINAGLQGKQKLEGEELEALALEAEMNPELNYLSDDYELALTQVANVDGEKAYVLEVTDKLGKTRSEYYAVETGLKLKTESSEETPQGVMNTTTKYSDYQEVEGVMYPHSMTIVNGPQTIQFSNGSIVVNGELSDENFKL